MRGRRPSESRATNVVTAEPINPAGPETVPSGAGEQGSESGAAPRVPRRNLLAWLTVGLGGIATAVVGLLVTGLSLRPPHYLQYLILFTGAGMGCNAFKYKAFVSVLSFRRPHASAIVNQESRGQTPIRE